MTRQLSLFSDDEFDEPPRPSFVAQLPPQRTFPTHTARVKASRSLFDPPPAPAGPKTKAREIVTAIRTLKRIEEEKRLATPEEREILGKFGGFGPVALTIFPDPVTGNYKPGWESMGNELKALLTPEEYASAKRTTFNAFYTSPTVITAMHHALHRLGVRDDSLVLEPGCGVGRFISQAPSKMQFIGVELDSISGRIAKARHPGADIRIENFRDSVLPKFDAVIGNVPFADVKLDYNGQKFSLHDYFFAKSVDQLSPGGVLALVTSHYTLDKQNGAIREYLSDRADFLGAIRLPSDAFKQEGTSVVTDIIFLRKRGDEPAAHVDNDWLATEPTQIDGNNLPINKYFLNHPEMVLGTYSGNDSLYGEGYSVVSIGDISDQLKEAVGRLPTPAPNSRVSYQEIPSSPQKPSVPPPALRFVPPPPERHITEGSFFVHEGRICQKINGQSSPVVYGGGELWANGGLVGRRLGHLIELRDKARYVLRSQNEGWPESAREDARRSLNLAYDAFKSSYGAINKTTFSETKNGSTIRRVSLKTSHSRYEAIQ